MKHAISNELSHILFSCKFVYVDRGDRDTSREPEPTLNCLRNDQITEGNLDISPHGQIDQAK